MCYDIQAMEEAQLRRIRLHGDRKAEEEAIERLVPKTDLPLFHASGFSHPELLIYTDEDPFFPSVATWGLIPHWVKDEAGMKKIWNNTLNARGETLFEKPSFRYAAEHNRCLVYINGFYEHHHFNNTTYPFFIFRKDGEPLILAGLWSEWTNEEGKRIKSFTIVTTEGNTLMSKIHNNPKLEGPRMPLILPEELADRWLKPISEELDKKMIQELIMSFPEDELDFHTVSKLRGKDYPGNVETISDAVVYDDLKFC